MSHTPSPRPLFGREEITSSVARVDASNVVRVLESALKVHAKNRADIVFLDRYHRGEQPILKRVKDVRPEICNRVVENRAAEIVSFKVGYLMGEPVQYVARGGGRISRGIRVLNDCMHAVGKSALDQELAEDFTVCGTAYRLILPNPSFGQDEEAESPFDLFTLPVADTFVVYSNRVEREPLLGCTYAVREEDGQKKTVYSVYTADSYYELEDGSGSGSPPPSVAMEATASPTGSVGGLKLVSAVPHALGHVPIIEYPAGRARQGGFEIVVPILDAMNAVASNRMDGIEQFVQALMMFKGVNISEEDYKKLKDEGAILVPPDGDIKYLVQELNQLQTQTLVDYMYNTALVICGMPNRNGGSSTSDTGAAVIMRDGWSDAEARAKKTEMVFKRSERRTLTLALRILRGMGVLKTAKPLKLSDIEIRFTRRNYENIQMKSQVLTTMLGCEKIDPRLAFAYCNLFPDPEEAYASSARYYEERQNRLAAELDAAAKAERDKSASSTPPEGEDDA